MVSSSAATGGEKDYREITLALNCCTASRPSMPGSPTSSNTRSGRSRCAIARPSSAVAAELVR